MITPVKISGKIEQHAGNATGNLRLDVVNTIMKLSEFNFTDGGQNLVCKFAIRFNKAFEGSPVDKTTRNRCQATAE